jgi:hypothetical protein
VDTNTLFVDAANNRVGVGTSSPLSPLVVAEGTGQHGFEVQPGTLTYVFAYDRATADYGDLDIAGQTLRFGTDNGVERMRITSTGSVGIGTSSPATTLDVVGSAQIGANAAKTKFYSDSTYSGIFNGATLGSNESVYMGAGALFFYGGGVERLRIDAAGNVGIGAAGSFSGVDIYKSGSTTSVVAARNDTSTTLMYATTSASFAGTTTNTPYGFVTNNTERMRIDASGIGGDWDE